MKAATLVSRCSEKDLYDLILFFEEFSDYRISNLVEMGSEIGSGINGETLMYSIGTSMI